MTWEQGYVASPPEKSPCQDPGCTRMGPFRGLCQKHHIARGFMGRLLAYVDKTDHGCWLWNGPTFNGYGQRTLMCADGKKRTKQVHRVFYEEMVGPIPDGWQIDHLCRVTRCVNPRHLEAVTPRENTLRSSAPCAVSVATNACNRGHKWTATNLRVSNGKKFCRACLRIRAYELRNGVPHPAREDAEVRVRWTSTSRRIVTKEVSS